MHSQEHTPASERFLPLDYGSLELPIFSHEETLIRELPITPEQLVNDSRWSARIEGLTSLQGSKALREVDAIVQDFAGVLVENCTGLTEELRDRAYKAATLRQRSTTVPDSAEHFALRELGARINTLRFFLIERWLAEAPETGFNAVEREEYGSLCPAMAATDRMYIKMVTEHMPISSEERVEQGMINECCVVRMIDGVVREVPMHVAYPEETQAIIVAYDALIEKLELIAGQHTGDADDNVHRKLPYYRAVRHAFATSDPRDWAEADALLATQTADVGSVSAIHPMETSYMKDAVARTPEISLRAPDIEVPRVQELSEQTKQRMLASMNDQHFADIATMLESMELVGKCKSAARHFLSSGMDSFDLKPAGQILPNDFEARKRGGVDSSLDIETFRERQAEINTAFTAVFGDEMFKTVFEPAIDIEHMAGSSVAAHEYGHSVGIKDGTEERLGKSFYRPYIEEWKATCGDLVLNSWIPYERGNDDVTMDQLKHGVLGQIANAARYAKTRNHDSTKPYFRHSMMFMKVAEECGILTQGQEPADTWTFALEDSKVRRFYETVTEQYKALLKIYAEGSQTDLVHFLQQNLHTTAFVDYAAECVDKLNEGGEILSPAECATLPKQLSVQ